MLTADPNVDYFFVVFFFFGEGLAAGFAGFGGLRISTCVIFTGLSALELLPSQTVPLHGPWAIFLTRATVASSHCPKMV
jgi:hypothetical protein